MEEHNKDGQGVPETAPLSVSDPVVPGLEDDGDYGFDDMEVPDARQ